MFLNEAMSSSTLTMAPAAVGNSLTIHRSQSTPDFFAPFSDNLPHHPHHPSQPKRPDFSEKSLPSLPAYESAAIEIDFDDAGFDASSLSLADDFLGKDTSPPRQTITRTQTMTDAIISTRHVLDATQPHQLTTDDQENMHPGMARRRTLTERPLSWMGFRSTPDVRLALRDDIGAPPKYKAKVDAKREARMESNAKPLLSLSSWSVASSLPSFSRKPRRETSRSPSPTPSLKAEPIEEVTRARSKSNSSKLLAKMRPPSRSSSPIPRAADATPSAPQCSPSKRPGTPKKTLRTPTFLRKPQTVFLLRNSLDSDDSSSSCSSSTSSLAQTTFDTPGASQPSSDGGDATATEDTSASTNSIEVSAPRDPLWRSFKMLDSDLSKLDSKTTHFRMIVVRNSLLPFLTQYASHSSNRGLRAVDLEYRAGILDRWWNVLLDMLDGRTSGHITGNDRPQLVEALTMVMMRPEWRQSATYFLPLMERCPRERVKARRPGSSGSDGASLDSTTSSGSEFVAESALHNVRNLFIGNLAKQMVIVIDKVSVRNTPASLINFTGKACAYAFMFAPGVADVLVRLWGLSSDIIRRVADEFKLPRRSRGESDDIVALFPLNLHTLGWSSVKTMSDSLKHPAKLPLQVARANWFGPWVNKWKGRETDLFYIFCKYFYLLAAEFVPPGLPLVETARAPAFVLLHAQLLSLLDSTIHRQAAVDAMMGPPFGDSAHGSDASAMAITPFASNNLLRGMDQNRQIVLLKDFLADHSATGSDSRQTFATAFMALIKAATKRTSQYNHNACFTLCDFLEEAFTAYSSLEMHEHDTGNLIDWPFWLDVCRRIMENHNTMSEIRLLSFLFSVWDIIATNPQQKEELCRDWLLSEDMFSKLFTHWSPMVRAYYMRLLCWRICRDPGRADDDDVDSRIFTLASTRLKMVWSHYLWLKQSAEMECKYPPSTAPCYPTPGKKFLIIRTDMVAPGSANPSAFDSFSSPLTTPSGIDGPTPSPLSDSTQSSTKKRWSLLGRVLTLSNNNLPPRRPTMEEDLEQVRREMAVSRTGPPPPPKPSYAMPASSSDTFDRSNTSSPSIDEDYSSIHDGGYGNGNSDSHNGYIFRFVLSWHGGPGAMPPRERILYSPRLPGPAQSRVNTRNQELDNYISQPAAGLPIATRRISGLATTGLIAEARNADPAAEIPDHNPQTPRTSISTAGRPSFSSMEGSRAYLDDYSAVTEEEWGLKPPTAERMAQAKYSGKALAEWTLVVMECNAFIERRREEGVLGLTEVEVPNLGVEGFRKM